MNTCLFETCRRQYNWIKSLMKKCAFFGSYYIVGYHKIQLKKCKVSEDLAVSYLQDPRNGAATSTKSKFILMYTVSCTGRFES